MSPSHILATPTWRRERGWIEIETRRVESAGMKPVGSLDIFDCLLLIVNRFRRQEIRNKVSHQTRNTISGNAHVKAKKRRRGERLQSVQ